MLKTLKNNYVVLIHAQTKGVPDQWHETIPINHVYQLKTDFTKYNFHVFKDILGKENGWHINTNREEKNSPYGLLDFKEFSSLVIRPATEEEIIKYKQANLPVSIHESKKIFLSHTQTRSLYLESLIEGINP